MPTAGPNSWGTSADDSADGGTVAWGVTGSPGSPSVSSWSGTAVSHYLKLTNFGLSLTPGIGGAVSINGIQVVLTTTFTVGSGGWSPKDNSVKLVIAGALAGTEHSTGAGWGGAITYGNTTSDAWGEAAQNASNFTASNFGCALQGIGTVAGGGGSGSLTGATIAIGYTPLLDAWISSDAILSGNPAVLAWGRWAISADGSNHFDRLSDKLRDWLAGTFLEIGMCREQVRDEFAGFVSRGGLWLPNFVQTRAVSFAG